MFQRVCLGLETGGRKKESKKNLRKGMVKLEDFGGLVGKKKNLCSPPSL